MENYVFFIQCLTEEDCGGEVSFPDQSIKQLCPGPETGAHLLGSPSKSHWFCIRWWSLVHGRSAQYQNQLVGLVLTSWSGLSWRRVQSVLSFIAMLCYRHRNMCPPDALARCNEVPASENPKLGGFYESKMGVSNERSIWSPISFPGNRWSFRWPR